MNDLIKRLRVLSENYYSSGIYKEAADALEAKDREIARLRDINKRAQETIDSALKETDADKFVAENYRLHAALEEIADGVWAKNGAKAAVKIARKALEDGK
jgi:hypothetical protein